MTSAAEIETTPFSGKRIVVHPALGIGGLCAGELVWMTTRAVVNARRFRSQQWMPADVRSRHQTSSMSMMSGDMNEG